MILGITCRQVKLLLFLHGTGYSVKRSSAGDVSFTGTLNVDNAGVDVVLSSTGNRFNLLGNPYTSHIASATFLANEGAVSETQTLWVWNQGSGSGAYEVKTLGDAMVIAPAQGFFVKANAAGVLLTLLNLTKLAVEVLFKELTLDQKYI